MFVLGTAGHVDHGKSTLLGALTSQNPDRLPEEKKRGMTIEPNFFWLDTPGFGRVGFVDVPGHVRFVKNMVTGAASFDAFLFVVAADDGWMPQSEEHARILKALGVTDGLVIVTKTDLVDEAHLREVEAEIAARGEALGMARPFRHPVRFSAKGSGDLVLRELHTLLARLPSPETARGARLFVDRVFSPKGQGLVVTGILREGALAVGDELHLLPKEKKVSVRSLQAYGKSVDEVSPVSRVAVGLSGASESDVGRGSVLLLKSLVPTQSFEAQVTFWAKRPKRNFEASLHWETAKRRALVVPLGEADGVTAVRLKLDSSLPLRSGERFLLRTSGEEKSWGGGVIVDTRPPKETKARAALRILAFVPSAEGWDEYLRNNGPWLDREHVSLWSRMTEEKLCDCIGAVPVGTRYGLRETALLKVTTHWDRRLTAIVENRAKGLTADEVEREFTAQLGVKPPEPMAEALCEVLVAKSLLRREEGGFVPPSFRHSLSPEQARWREEALALVKGREPVSLKEWYRTEENKRELVHRWAREGTLVFLDQDHFMEKTVWDEYRAEITARLRTGPQTTVALRDALKLSRKNAVLILEKLDRDGVTYFRNNERHLKKG